MGGAKEMMLKAEDDRRWALDVLAEAGVLECCEAHGEYYAGANEVEEAYKLANRKISAGVAPLRKTKGAMQQTLLSRLMKSITSFTIARAAKE
jgi:hypothetical protein